MVPYVNVSIGELVDKTTILEIKMDHAKDPVQLAFLGNEYRYLLSQIANLTVSPYLMEELIAVNRTIWDIEDQIRIYERKQDFGENFIRCARDIYIKNDERYSIKKRIDTTYNSEFQEQKILPAYK